MANTINAPAGYIGYLVNPIPLRCTSFGVNSSQDILFYNHILGINDTVAASGMATKGESPGTRQTGRRFFRPSVVNLGGSFAFPATDQDNASYFFDLAQNGGYIDSLDFMYYCPTVSGHYSVSYKKARVGNFELSAQAGEPLSITVDIGALDLKINEIQGSQYTTAEKLITWDVVKVITTPTINNIKGVTLHINNNLSPVFTNNTSSGVNIGNNVTTNSTNNLFPYDLRLGVQEVSGTVSFYLNQGQSYIQTTKTQPDTIRIEAGDLIIDAYIMFQTTQAQGAVGPIICELPFIGVADVWY